LHLWLTVLLAAVLTASAFPAAAGEPEVTLTVINRTDVDICYLYLSPAGSDNWGLDRLGTKDTIPPGDSVDIELTPGRYDALAEDCDGETLAEVRGADISTDRKWTVRQPAPREREPAQDDEDEGEGPLGRPTPPPSPTPVALDQLLCCGQSVGGTLVWSIRYPRGWEVEYFGTPRQFLGAAIFDPQGSIRVTLIPSGQPEAGSPMDTGEIESALDGLVKMRQAEDPGFAEFMRAPVPGALDTRLWGGTWPGETEPMWEVYIIYIGELLDVGPMFPHTFMSLFGVRAASSDWAAGVQIYEDMLATAQFKSVDGKTESGAAGLGQPAVEAGMVRFCPKQCAWEWISASVDGGACPVYGEESYPYEVPCE
jgi:hypothetical protein